MSTIVSWTLIICEKIDFLLFYLFRGLLGLLVQLNIRVILPHPVKIIHYYQSATTRTSSGRQCPLWSLSWVVDPRAGGLRSRREVKRSNLLFFKFFYSFWKNLNTTLYEISNAIQWCLISKKFLKNNILANKQWGCRGGKGEREFWLILF